MTTLLFENDILRKLNEDSEDTMIFITLMDSAGNLAEIVRSSYQRSKDDFTYSLKQTIMVMHKEIYYVYDKKCNMLAIGLLLCNKMFSQYLFEKSSRDAFTDWRNIPVLKEYAKTPDGKVRKLIALNFKNL
jgi:hypothetical protein